MLEEEEEEEMAAGKEINDLWPRKRGGGKTVYFVLYTYFQIWESERSFFFFSFLNMPLSSKK